MAELFEPQTSMLNLESIPSQHSIDDSGPLSLAEEGPADAFVNNHQFEAQSDASHSRLGDPSGSPTPGRSTSVLEDADGVGSGEVLSTADATSEAIIELEELRKHRYYDEEDERAEGVDLQVKIDTIQASLSEQMRAAIAARRQCAGEQTLSPFEVDASRNGVDVQQLRDIKAAFEIAGSRGIPGIPEDDFMEMFGPTLCAGMNTEQMRLWFRTIDANCSGAVSWNEISHFLSEYKGGSERNRRNPFVDYTIEPVGPVVARKRHKQPLTQLVYNPALDVIYTGGPDGLVQVWNPSTLRALPEPVHDGNVRIACMSRLPHNNRLMVLKADRSIFVYDTFIDKNQKKHELYRAFATDGKSVRRLADGTPFYDSNRVELRNAPIIRSPAFSNPSGSPSTPVSLLEASSDGMLCLDHLGGASMGEPTVCGMESGQLHFFSLLMGSTRPIKAHTRYRVHDGWVTACRFAPELGGIITSSLDEFVCVTDVEKGFNLQRMAPAKRKPVFSFDYSRFHNILLTAGGRTMHVWNALTGARLASLPDHEAPVTHVTLNPGNQTALALLENKTVKVWDLRTWRSLGCAADVTPRYPSDTLGGLLWCEPHHLLVTGCTELFGWRPAEVQERIDAGLPAVSSLFFGHLHPIKELHLDRHSGHITAIDTHNVCIWGIEQKKILAQWKWPESDDQLQCSAFDPEGVRLLVGTENGKVAWYNYASGYKMYTLKHDVKNAAVNCCVVLPGVAVGTPPIAIAGCGNRAMSWIADKINVFDLPGPTAQYVYAEDADAICSSIAMVDPERQVLAVAFSTGSIVLLTIGLAPLNDISFRIPAELIVPVSPNVFLSCHSDGTVKFTIISNRTYNLDAVANIPAATEVEEAATCAAICGEALLVGDAGGCITMFRARKLLSSDFMRKEVIPMHFAGKREPTNTVAQDIQLIRSLRAHTGPLTGLAVLRGELFSAGADRQLRCWNASDLTLKEEMGNLGSLAFTPQDVTKLHQFRVGETLSAVSGGVLESPHAAAPGLTKALSFTRLASMRRKSTKLSDIALTRKPVCEVSPAATRATILGDALAGSSTGGRPQHLPPINAAAASHRSPSISSVVSTSFRKAQRADPRVRQAPTEPEMFRLAADRVARVRPQVDRSIPLNINIQQQLQEIAKIREERLSEIVEARRTFTALRLAPVTKPKHPIRRSGSL